jgi:hypothetical protein
MTWAFDVTGTIPRITQSGTDTGLSGLGFEVLPTVGKSFIFEG